MFFSLLTLAAGTHTLVSGAPVLNATIPAITDNVVTSEAASSVIVLNPSGSLSVAALVSSSETSTSLAPIITGASSVESTPLPPSQQSEISVPSGTVVNSASLPISTSANATRLSTSTFANSTGLPVSVATNSTGLPAPTSTGLDANSTVNGTSTTLSCWITTTVSSGISANSTGLAGVGTSIVNGTAVNATAPAIASSTSFYGACPVSTGASANFTASSHASITLGHVITGKSSASVIASTGAVTPPSSTGAVVAPSLPPPSLGAVVPPSSLGPAPPLSSTGDLPPPPSPTSAAVASSASGGVPLSQSLGAATSAPSYATAPPPAAVSQASASRSFATVPAPSHSSHSRTCPRPNPQVPFRFWTIDDVDACEFPPLDKYPVVAWPLDSSGQTREDPSLALWFALSMDQWLDDLFTGCPAALDARTDESDGTKHEVFSRVLGRLMFGQNDGAFSDIHCDQNRCAWNANSGWCRGDMFPYETSPCIEKSTCPPGHTKTDLLFVEKVRRWYTMQALGNVWTHKKSVAAAMQLATPAVSGRMQQFLNDWAATYVPGYEKPTISPFSAIFGIFKSIASFIPVAGPAISSALNAADLISGFIDPSGIPAKADEKTLLIAENRQAVEDAIVASAKGIVGAVTTVLEVSGEIKEALKDGEWVPEKWDPVFPIAGADMQAKLASVFTNMAKAMSQVFDDSINGPPLGPNGFLTLVKGGLYSTSSSNPDVMRKDSLDALIPTYVAFTEDKLLQAVMRSYGIFFMTDTFSNQADCEVKRQQDHGDWAGSLCFPSTDGVTWRSLTPYPSRFGYEERPHKDTGHERWGARQILHQIWPFMTAVNVRDKLRGDLSSRDHPADIVDIYQKLSACFDATNNGVHHRPSKGGSSTGFKLFPDEMPTPTSLPLDALCHWNLPVVAPYPVGVQDDERACMDDYVQDDLKWTFRTGQYGSAWAGKSWDVNSFPGYPTFESSGMCKVKENGWIHRQKCNDGMTIKECEPHDGWWNYKYESYSPRPGPALYYARALAYPAHPECVLGSEHLDCPAF